MSSLLNPTRYVVRPVSFGQSKKLKILNANRVEVLETTPFLQTLAQKKLQLSKNSTYFCYCCIDSLLSPIYTTGPLSLQAVWLSHYFWKLLYQNMFANLCKKFFFAYCCIRLFFCKFAKVVRLKRRAEAIEMWQKCAWINMPQITIVHAPQRKNLIKHISCSQRRLGEKENKK